MCVMEGGVCTATSDCCNGLPCIIPNGQTQGTCGMPMNVPDGGMPCSLVGQSCSTTNPCCNGLLCDKPDAVTPCAQGEMDCTCIGSIG
jgi:hypothetical protein